MRRSLWVVWAALMGVARVMAFHLAEKPEVNAALGHKDQILRLHNGYRGLAGAADMRELVWSDKLAEKAFRGSLSCNYNGARSKFGENKFFEEMYRDPDDIMVGKALDTWFSEKRSWERYPRCAESCQYTQMVWARTKKIGCGFKKCNNLNMNEEYAVNAWFLICLYDEKGNDGIHLPFRRGKACKLCSTNEICKQGLCANNTTQTTTNQGAATANINITNATSSTNNTDADFWKRVHQKAYEQSREYKGANIPKTSSVGIRIKTMGQSHQTKQQQNGVNVYDFFKPVTPPNMASAKNLKNINTNRFIQLSTQQGGTKNRKPNTFYTNKKVSVTSDNRNQGYVQQGGQQQNHMSRRYMERQRGPETNGGYPVKPQQIETNGAYLHKPQHSGRIDNKDSSNTWSIIPNSARTTGSAQQTYISHGGQTVPSPTQQSVNVFVTRAFHASRHNGFTQRTRQTAHPTKPTVVVGPSQLPAMETVGQESAAGDISFRMPGPTAITSFNDNGFNGQSGNKFSRNINIRIPEQSQRNNNNNRRGQNGRSFDQNNNNKNNWGQNQNQQVNANSRGQNNRFKSKQSVQFSSNQNTNNKSFKPNQFVPFSELKKNAQTGWDPNRVVVPHDSENSKFSLSTDTGKKSFVFSGDPQEIGNRSSIIPRKEVKTAGFQAQNNAIYNNFNYQNSYTTPRTTTTRPTTTASPRGVPGRCVDTDPYCEGWAVYCKDNIHVFENCRKTCGTCSVPPPPDTQPTMSSNYGRAAIASQTDQGAGTWDFQQQTTARTTVHRLANLWITFPPNTTTTTTTTTAAPPNTTVNWATANTRAPAATTTLGQQWNNNAGGGWNSEPPRWETQTVQPQQQQSSQNQQGYQYNSQQQQPFQQQSPYQEQQQQQSPGRRSSNQQSGYQQSPTQLPPDYQFPPQQKPPKQVSSQQQPLQQRSSQQQQQQQQKKNRPSSRHNRHDQKPMMQQAQQGNQPNQQRKQSQRPTQRPNQRPNQRPYQRNNGRKHKQQNGNQPMNPQQSPRRNVNRSNRPGGKNRVQAAAPLWNKGNQNLRNKRPRKPSRIRKQKNNKNVLTNHVPWGPGGNNAGKAFLPAPKTTTQRPTTTTGGWVTIDSKTLQIMEKNTSLPIAGSVVDKVTTVSPAQHSPSTHQPSPHPPAHHQPPPHPPAHHQPPPHPPAHHQPPPHPPAHHQPPPHPPAHHQPPPHNPVHPQSAPHPSPPHQPATHPTPHYPPEPHLGTQTFFPPSPPPTQPFDPFFTPCDDTDAQCHTWTSYCGQNQYVDQNCHYTCGRCNQFLF